MSDDNNVNIYSGVHDGKPVCSLEWGTVRTILQIPVVLTTARDLQAAASAAETDIALIRVMQKRLGANIQTIGAFLQDIRTERPMMTAGKSALRIEAVAGAHTGQPYVHIARGSMGGSISPDEARQMATHWIETAVAANNDARLRYVLGEYHQLTPADIDGIFAGLRRAGGDHITQRNT